MKTHPLDIGKDVTIKLPNSILTGTIKANSASGIVLKSLNHSIYFIPFTNIIWLREVI